MFFFPGKNKRQKFILPLVIKESFQKPTIKGKPVEKLQELWLI
jgi:hypothetical protein